MIAIMDEWIESWGIWAIIVGRAVPLIMFDPVSYAAGLSNIKSKQYYLASIANKEYYIRKDFIIAGRIHKLMEDVEDIED